MKKLILASAMLLAVPAVALADGDAEAGKAVFNKCAVCHKIGANSLGPNLQCVVGRKAGTAEGYDKYSDALKDSGITWDAAKLAEWVANPKAVVPGTKMIFPGLSAEADRANLVAYLTSECKK